MRLDKYLVKNGFFESGNKAKEAVLDGKVKVNNKTITKPSFDVDNPLIEIEGEVFVSRSALKLKNYIDEFRVDVLDKLALDIGSSTGGFSEVLLKYGVRKVVCVDVGKGQLHTKILTHPKTEVYEQTDIRNFSYNNKFDIVVSDVSFISLSLILDKIIELSRGDIILLFKPQFEVGKDVKRDKKGVVKDKVAIQKSLDNFLLEAQKKGLSLIRVTKSSILGKDGNIEYILHFKGE
jgi:23S rRNA (cytidine1920-2'-O)/16S rRNA (cytidine1409-2'-O)-methyltransferase